MTYTDGIHLIADHIEELHAFARSIDLPRHWFSLSKHGRIPHYDLYKDGYLRKLTFEKAILKGAKIVSTKQIILISKYNAL